MASALFEEYALIGEKCNKKRSVLMVVGQVAVSLFFLGSLTLIALSSPSGNGNHINKRKDLYQKISMAADINTDSYTSHDEWARVYNELGLQYDVHSSNPECDLSWNQMRRYQENHQ